MSDIADQIGAREQISFLESLGLKKFLEAIAETVDDDPDRLALRMGIPRRSAYDFHQLPLSEKIARRLDIPRPTAEGMLRYVQQLIRDGESLCPPSSNVPLPTLTPPNSPDSSKPTETTEISI